MKSPFTATGQILHKQYVILFFNAFVVAPYAPGCTPESEKRSKPPSANIKIMSNPYIGKTECKQTVQKQSFLFPSRQKTIYLTLSSCSPGRHK